MMSTVGLSDPVDRVFQAIAHAGRRHLLTRLGAERGLTLGGLCEHLPMTRQAVSQHLKLLERAGLVVTRWHGREKLHYLNPTPLCEAYDVWFAPLITREARALVGLRDGLENEGGGGFLDSEAADAAAGERGRGA